MCYKAIKVHTWYLLMCLQLTTLSWHAASNKLHWEKRDCVYELLQHADYRCRCVEYLTLLPQQGDD